MPQCKLLRNPGYVYDLMFVFYQHFNMDYFMSDFQDESDKREMMSFCKELRRRFGVIPEDLYLFFHADANTGCFMTTRYFKPYKKHFLSDYDVLFLLSELSDREKLVHNLIRFYFSDLSKAAQETCLQDRQAALSYIKQTKHTGDVKNRLYEFFLDPDYYMDLLCKTLEEMDEKLADYYREHEMQLDAVAQRFSTEEIVGQIKALDGDVSVLEGEETVLYRSFCLLNYGLILRYTYDDGILFLCGYRYEDFFEKIYSLQQPDLQKLGSALAEESRIKILYFLLERGEATCKDLERAFSFSGSTAYHHLMVLIRSGVLCSRTQGKSVYYSINHPYFDRLVDVISVFASKTAKE